MSADQKLLVTTALKETWGEEDRIIFLGEWCKCHEFRDVWERRDYETIDFHWNDREKLSRDYDYLASIHRSILESLARALNEFHKVEYSLRYWQILIDPWLMSYLGVMFDRWESLRLAFEKNNRFSMCFYDSELPGAPFSYSEFVQLSAYSDAWNQLIYQRIAGSEYHANINVRLIDSLSMREVTVPPSRLRPRLGFVRKIYSDISCFFGHKLRSQDVVFVGSAFNPRALAKIKSALGQSRFNNELDELNSPNGTSVVASLSTGVITRSGIQVDFIVNTRFENFIKAHIVNDIPRCLIESYSVLRVKARSISIQPKVIVTGSSHWGDAQAKMWFAEKTVTGTKLVVQEHGGSLPPFKELFDFESDISDVRTSWFTPYHTKHVRMPPPKIIGSDQSIASRLGHFVTQRKYCSLIGNECPRWVFRAHFYPMANQWLNSFQMTLEMFDNLDEDVKRFFRVKPYPTQGWNSALRYSEAVGSDKVFNKLSLSRVYAMSRVILCSYPETTFSEAMASGVPTVLVYPDKFYELNPVALPLLDILRSAKIVFHDPLLAAAHLNSIWGNPDQWWSSPLVVLARSEFNRQALDMDSGWLDKWIGFFKGVAAEATHKEYAVSVKRVI